MSMTRDLVMTVKGIKPNIVVMWVKMFKTYMTIEIPSTRLPEACGEIQTYEYVLKIYKKTSL